jgi:hypothetical protein
MIAIPNRPMYPMRKARLPPWMDAVMKRKLRDNARQQVQTHSAIHSIIFTIDSVESSGFKNFTDLALVDDDCHSQQTDVSDKEGKATSMDRCSDEEETQGQWAKEHTKERALDRARSVKNHRLQSRRLTCGGSKYRLAPVNLMKAIETFGLHTMDRCSDEEETQGQWAKEHTKERALDRARSVKFLNSGPISKGNLLHPPI